MWKAPSIILMGLLLASVITPSYAVDFNENALKHIPDRFVVVLKDDVNQDEFLKKHDVEKLKHYKHALNGLAVKGPPEKINKIRNDPQVLFVEQDKEFYILGQSLPTGIDRINAELNTIAKIDGVNDLLDVDIAIIDTGIDSDNPDLNIAGGINFVGTNSAAWNDGHGHGTHVAGTVAASDNTIGVAGVAPDARLWAVKVLSDTGSGTLIDVVEGVDWVTANAGIIEVANLSLGGSGSDDGNCGYSNFDSLHIAICNSVAKGVVYAVAAGNSNSNAMVFIPAAYDEVITVSAIADFDGLPGGNGSPTCRTDVDDTFADFSNHGVDVDIAAPGVCILSTWKDGSYVYASGTSMATPHVSGAAALYIIANGKPTNFAGVQQVKQGLLNSATPQNDPNGFVGDPDIYREPLLNVESINSSEPVHDITVSSLNSPDSANQGDLVNVEVTVNNIGTFSETFDVTLTDTTDSKVIGVKTTTVSSGGSQILSFSWDALSASEGNHVLEAEAAAVVGETNLSNNVKTKQINIQVPYDGPSSVTITSPSDSSTVNGRVTILATTSGFSGTTIVKFYVDGSLKHTDSSEPYEYGWHTKGEATGSHSIMVQASDSYGNSATDSITVEIPQKGKASSKGNNAKQVQEIDFVAESAGIQNFAESVVNVPSAIPVEIIRNKIAALSSPDEELPDDFSNLDRSVSEIAQLHKMFGGYTEEEINDFKILFHQYKAAVNEILGIGQEIEQKQIQQNLLKTELKLEMQLAKIKEVQANQNKINTAIELSKKMDELIKTRTEIGILQHSTITLDEKDKKLKELYDIESMLIKELMIAEASHNNNELTQDDIKKIEQDIENENNSQSQSKSSDVKSNNSKQSDNGNNGKGNSDNGNKASGNGKSKK